MYSTGRRLILQEDDPQKEYNFDSCELAVFHHSTEKIKSLCQLSLLNIVETAIPLTTRRTLLFAKEQQLDITCRFPKEPTRKEKTYHPRVKGLAMITLPEEGDCTCSSLHHFWRNDPGITALAQPQVRPINLNASTLFRYPLEEMNDYLEKLDISTYTPTSIEAIQKTIDKIKFNHKGKMFGLSTIIVGGIFFITLIGILACLYWQRRRIMEAISYRKRPRGANRVNDEDPKHTHALGLLFRNGKINQHNGPFCMEEYDKDSVMIVCQKDDLEDYLKNFDNMLLQKQLTHKKA